jgi:hypothetical protein
VKELDLLLNQAHQKRAKYIVLFIKRGINTFFIEMEPVWPELP